MQKKGFLNIQVSGLKIIPKEGTTADPLILGVKVGELEAKSDPQPTDAAWSQQFLLQVNDENTRAGFKLNQGDRLVGQCRFDIKPLMQYEGNTNVIESDMMDLQNQPGAKISLRLTYYSARYGRLRIRIDELSLNQAVAAKAKQISARFKLGPFIKTTAPKKYPCGWGEVIELIVLTPTANLTVEAVSEGQTIGEYVVYNVEKSGLLKEKKKLENNLFWDEKHAGKIKYEVEPLQE